VREQHAQGERISKTGIKVRDIKHPKSSEEGLKRYTSAQENLTPQGTKSHNREQKEGTPGIPVTGNIIGDQPGVNWK
jgi:hypothetical protein